MPFFRLRVCALVYTFATMCCLEHPSGRSATYDVFHEDVSCPAERLPTLNSLCFTISLLRIARRSFRAAMRRWRRGLQVANEAEIYGVLQFVDKPMDVLPRGLGSNPAPMSRRVSLLLRVAPASPATGTPPRSRRFDRGSPIAYRSTNRSVRCGCAQ